ncbi:MAG: hypothetical protein ACON4O_07420 [Lentimonas sp.]
MRYLKIKWLCGIGSTFLALLGVSALEYDEAFFPAFKQHSAESLQLRGLAELYPNTILFEAPELKVRSLREEAASIETIPPDITYVRIYRLEEAIDVIQKVIESPALILDMRYLQSESAGMELARLLNNGSNTASVTVVGEVPVSITTSKTKLEKETTPRKHPAIVLCNRQTAGPFEAMLHSLQSNQSVIAVGEATAGRTGSYKKTNNEIWMIKGEVRPDADTSLLATGFIPRIAIDATPETNYLSYNLYEAGTPISHLLRGERITNEAVSENEDRAADGAETFEPDAVLQRAVDIVAALQILQQLPDNH